MPLLTIAGRQGMPVVGMAAPAEEIVTSIVTAAVEPVAAAVEDDESSDWTWTIIAWLLVIVGAFAARYIVHEWRDPEPFTPGPEISIFAPFYILAQAIERLLEPLTPNFGRADGKTKKEAANDRDAALVAAHGLTEKSQAKAKLQEAAKHQALVNRIRRNRAVVVWGLASLLAMLACGAFGILLLAAVGFDVPVFMDIAITGLAVGAGTKPLHDLISNIQKTKESKEDPSAVQTTT